VESPFRSNIPRPLAHGLDLYPGFRTRNGVVTHHPCELRSPMGRQSHAPVPRTETHFVGVGLRLCGDKISSNKRQLIDPTAIGSHVVAGVLNVPSKSAGSGER